MTQPSWIKETIAAQYGSGYEIPESESVVALLQDEVEHLWPAIEAYIPSATRPNLEFAVVDSPAGSPTTFTDGQTDVLVCDIHLVELLVALTTLSFSEVSDKATALALTSIYAERAFSAGKMAAATILEAGSRIAVASCPATVLPENEFIVIQMMARIELSFVVAHELAHFAMGSSPESAARVMERHEKLFRDIFRVTDEHDSLDYIQQMRQNLTSLSSGRYNFGDILKMKMPEPGVDVWDRLTQDENFMAEIMADTVACTAILVTLRKSYPLEALIRAIGYGVSNLTTLQYMDDLAMGHTIVSLDKDRSTPYWQTMVRTAIALLSTDLTVESMKSRGYFEEEVDQILRQTITVLNQSYFQRILIPLVSDINFEEIASSYLEDATAAKIAHGVSQVARDVRQFLGFGLSVPAKATAFKYLNVRVVPRNG